MTKELETVHGLIARLIRAIIDNPSFLVLRNEPLPGRVNWLVDVHIDDQGKVIGKGGCHIKAIQFLVARMGLRYGQQFRVEIEDPRTTRRSPDNAPRKATEYDPRDARDLLGDILEEILAGAHFFMEVVPDHERDGRASFVFKINPKTTEARDAITQPCDPIGRGNAQTVEGALGTLFRAFGLVEGVSFVVEVVE